MPNVVEAIELGVRLGKLEGRSATMVVFVGVTMGILTSLFLGFGGYLYATSQDSISELEQANKTLGERINSTTQANAVLKASLDMLVISLVEKANPDTSLRSQ